MSIKINVGDISIEVDGDAANVTVGDIQVTTYNNHTVINRNVNYTTNNLSSRKSSVSIGVGDSVVESMVGGLKALLS